MCEADLVDEDDSTRALAADFDHDPERFAANKQATQRYSMIGDMHDRVADRLAKITVDAILDLGGGNGTLARSLNPRWRGNRFTPEQQEKRQPESAPRGPGRVAQAPATRDVPAPRDHRSRRPSSSDVTM
jgi:hypothetical protein